MAKLTILLVTTLFSILATGTIRDKDIDELSKIIQKEIELKRKAVDILQKKGVTNDVKAEDDEDLPLSLNNWVKKDKTSEKEETKKEISIKSDIKSVLLKKDVTDDLVNAMYKRLKSEASIPFSYYSRLQSTDERKKDFIEEENESEIPLYMYKRNNKKDDRENSKEGDSFSSVLSERPRRGPPGLWGKKDGERRELKPAPPGIWGDEEELKGLPLKWVNEGKRENKNDQPLPLWARPWGKKDGKAPKHFGSRWGKKDGQRLRNFGSRWGKRGEEIPEIFKGRWGKKDEENQKENEEKRYLHKIQKPPSRWGGRYGDGGKNDIELQTNERLEEDEQKFKLSDIRKLLEKYQLDTLKKQRHLKEDTKTLI